MNTINSELGISRSLPNNKRLSVSLELTNLCNFCCPICPVSFRKHKQEQPAGAVYDRPLGMIDDAVFQRAVSECARVAHTVNLGFFGEQTLHSDYARLIGMLKGQPFKRDLNTNLGMVTLRTMKAWVDAEFDLVRFSLDAITPSLFNMARPGRVVDYAGQTVAEEDRIAALNEKVIKWLALPNRCPTQLVFVKSQYNDARELARFVEYWQHHLGPHDRILAKRILSYGGKIIDPNITPCSCNIWDKRYLMIDWRGMVSPCNLDTNMDLSLGNIMEHSIEELYFGSRAQKLRGVTGCLNDVTPCRTCADANNWESNEVWHGIKGTCAV